VFDDGLVPSKHLDPLTPVARNRRTGQLVWLLEWAQHPRDSSWRARVAWMVQRPGTWQIESAWMRGADLEQVDGKDYKHVPKHRELPDF
jgi:hypothetical protein